ncbi:hypothetical protein FLM9_58 [Candidatus Synechococcus spongiarum]|uniref:Uncharacterized protein n=1 Tax=Candidatus Synechococcus spongiarum TaxID=431041 RepID=A0A170T2K4_9SYNE|nr:hypothetical protein FLM9_58 [Candidatus Synechococcus spongiarum]
MQWLPVLQPQLRRQSGSQPRRSLAAPCTSGGNGWPLNMRIDQMNERIDRVYQLLLP